jgi:hypothetical protein
LVTKKTVSTIKYRLNKKTEEAIYMTWNEDHAKETQKNHNSQEHQGQGFEEEGNRLEKERGLIDIHEDTDLQIDRC